MEVMQRGILAVDHVDKICREGLRQRFSTILLVPDDVDGDVVVDVAQDIQVHGIQTVPRS